MKFGVQAKYDLARRAYLTNDDTWSKEKENLKEYDQLDMAKFFSRNIEEVVVEGKVYPVKREDDDLGLSPGDGKKMAFIGGFVAQYPTKLKTPDYEQMVEVIRQATDKDNHQLLYLDFKGNFNISYNGVIPSSWNPFAVRHPIWCQGNDYVGPGAAADPRHTNSTYKDMMNSWLMYLEHGLIDNFADGSCSSNLAREELVKKSNDLISLIKSR